MTDFVRIELQPLGKSLNVERGTALQDVLFDYGVEFPCGGTGRCRGCRVRVLQGELPLTPEQAESLTPDELAQGWRLACLCRADGPLVLDIDQWETPILTDHSSFLFTPSEGLGIAIDLGTTTLAAQLLDLQTGHVLAVAASLNPQAVYGADIMSRVQFSLSAGGQQRLQTLIRQELGRLICELITSASASTGRVRQVVLVGNTVMHHLFCSIDVTPLSHYPFVPVQDGHQVFAAAEIGWNLPADARVFFLPCLGGFVGSDILAGILATRMHEKEELSALIDLGTNGEIVIGRRGRLICASTAAGPAFEGGRISMGMQASTGAISSIQIESDGFKCHVIGNVAPRGICGSGLVDGVAAALDLGKIGPSGRLTGSAALLPLCSSVTLTQGDIRELQLAKGAIAAGIQILLDRWGAAMTDITCVYLAGAFGNYINRTSARRIGLLDFPEENVQPSGNTALLGAKVALFKLAAGEDGFESIPPQVTHIPLAVDPQFQDKYVVAMLFPG
jgi:uncharacterized 2Fe-2S/4Fe-4S cluster protein (DUF4445 family)